MKDRFNQFYSNLNGQHVEVSDSTNRNQCMDLGYNWVFALGFPKATIQRLYAKDVYKLANDLTRQYFEVIPNTPTGVPQIGDLVIFDAVPANIAGHISISNGVGNTTSFQSFDQNWIVGQKCTVVTHNYDNPNVLGWLRPKLPTVGEPVITDQTKIPQIDNLEVQAIKSRLFDQSSQINALKARMGEIRILAQ